MFDIFKYWSRPIIIENTQKRHVCYFYMCTHYWHVDVHPNRKYYGPEAVVFLIPESLITHLKLQIIFILILFLHITTINRAMLGCMTWIDVPSEQLLRILLMQCVLLTQKFSKKLVSVRKSNLKDWRKL